MKTKNMELPAALTAATVLANTTAEAASSEMDPLVAALKGKDDQARTDAWQKAGTLGAPAVKPLAALATNPEMEVARAAKRGLWKIVHTVGRPGAESERQAVVQELLPLLKDSSGLRREVLWMLSEIGGDESVQAIAGWLGDKEVREDARAALQRIPGQKSLSALQSALATAPAEFQPALADALRARGVRVENPPSQKLVPTKQTTVKPE